MDGYNIYHGYVCVPICICGLVLNALNIKVWYKRSHGSYSSLPIILTALSSTDFMVILSYFLFVIDFFLVQSPDTYHHHSETGMWIALVSFHMYILFTTWSNWTVVTLAIFRYIKLTKDAPTSRRLCSKYRAKLAIGIVFIVMFVILSPNYAFYKVKAVYSATNHTDYRITKTDFTLSGETYQRFLLWFSGIVMGLLPCIILVTCTSGMVVEVARARNENQLNFQSDRGRKTLMLMFILIMFLVAMLPIGIYAFKIAIDQPKNLEFFYFMKNLTVSDILYLLTIINSTCSFFIYLYFNRDFRHDIEEMCICRRRRSNYTELIDPPEENDNRGQVAVQHDPLFH